MLFSMQSFASLDLCYSHGTCQTTTQIGTKCYITKTGTDALGNTTCALRCLTVHLGQYCEKINSEVFGYCKQERVPASPAFDPQDPNRCDNAIELFP
jgi:hypothetical protein